MTNREEYDMFLSRVSKTMGLESMTPDAEGLLSFSIDGSYVLNLQYVERTSKILVFLELATLPATAGKTVYRELLSGALFGRETAGGFFAIEPESETVVYHYLFDFDAASADAEEFVSILEKILTLADVWADKIADALKDDMSETLVLDENHAGAVVIV